MSARWTEELDEAIRNYCFKQNLTMKAFFEKCWMSWNNYYMIRKRWIIWQNSLFKIKKYLKDFDFNSLPKTDLIIDKILGLGEFERDYAFFCPQTNVNNTPKDIILSTNVKSSLKNRISYIFQKDNKNKYDHKYEEEDDNDNKVFISRDNINMNRYWKPKKLDFSPTHSSNSKKYMNIKQNSFLSKVGNNIITPIQKYD